MNGRVRQHDANPRIARRQGLRQFERLSLVHEHDGPANGFEKVRLGIRALGEMRQAVPIRGHHRERLRPPAFALPQAQHRVFIFGIHRQVKAPQATQGQDFSLAQPIAGLLDGIAFDGLTLGIHQPKPGPAVGTSVGLGVVAPVGRILVLCLTSRAHGENLHGGLGAIVRHGLDDGITRPAKRAVDEGIVIPPVLWVREFRQAIWTSGHVERNERPGGTTGLGGQNHEIPQALYLGCFDLKGRNQGQAGHGLFEIILEFLQGLGRTFQFNDHALGGVADRAGQIHLVGQAINRRAKTHALYATQDRQANGLGCHAHQPAFLAATFSFSQP